MKRLSELFLFLFLIAKVTTGSAQNIAFKGKANILEFPSPYTVMKVDFIDNEKDFFQELQIRPDTKIIDKKGNPVLADNLIPGTEIEVVGEKVNYKNQVTEVKVTTRRLGDKVELDGLIEFYDPESGIAVIDGEKVKLAPGVAIKGLSKLKGKKFLAFSEISLGNFMTCEGVRQADGIIYATIATVKENEFDAYDQELRAALGDEFSANNIAPVPVPADLKQYTDALDQGYVQFGDAKFKLYDNLKVQAYVNYVGNKVVPQWQKDIPFDAPERLRFRFYVIENPTFNAFALPNGMVFVHTGLLTMLDNEAQLAAVLGHEIAHATYEHAKERYEKKKKTEAAKTLGWNIFRATLKVSDDDAFLARLLTSDVAQQGFDLTAKMAYELQKLPPQTKGAVRGLYLGMKGIASNDHSKEKESQSDRVGLFYMEQAGYDPREAANVWKKFMDLTSDENFVSKMNSTTKEWLTTSNMFPYKNPMQAAGDFIIGQMANKAMDNWFSSHPKATTRYRNLNQLVKTNYAKDDFSGMMVNVEEYMEVKALLKVK